jgi:hypothetical protein
LKLFALDATRRYVPILLAQLLIVKLVVVKFLQKLKNLSTAEVHIGQLRARAREIPIGFDQRLFGLKF